MFLEYLKKLIFHSGQSPDGLARVVNALAYPKEIGADVSIQHLDVAKGTTLATAKGLLPSTVKFEVGGIPFDASVTWGADTTPTFAPATAGTYALSGTLSNLPAFAKNTGNKVAKVNIVVANA